MWNRAFEDWIAVELHAGRGLKDLLGSDKAADWLAARIEAPDAPAGMNEHLSKPIDPKDLFTCLFNGGNEVPVAPDCHPSAVIRTNPQFIQSRLLFIANSLPVGET